MVKEGKEKKQKKTKRGDGDTPAERQDGAAYQMPPQMMMGMQGTMHPQMAMMMGMRGVAMGHPGRMPHMMMPPMGMPPSAGFPPGAPFAPRGAALAVGHARRSKRPPERPETTLPAASQPEHEQVEVSSSSSSSDSSSSSSSSGKKSAPAVENTAPEDQVSQVAGDGMPASSEPMLPGALRAASDHMQEETSMPLPEIDAPQKELSRVAVNTATPDVSEESMPTRLKKPKPKLGKISFNIQGGSIAAAQAKTQVEEALAAERARRLNTKDASTQTVRDPETMDGDIVTIWRLRPRGMESFPHFPKATKKKAREPKICALGDGEEAEAVGNGEDDDSETGKKRKLAMDTTPWGKDNVPMQDASVDQVAPAVESDQEDSPADDVLQKALAQSANSTVHPVCVDDVDV